MGVYLFICLFFCIGLGWRASVWNATFKNARDPEEAFKLWVPEMCILFYQFWKGKRAKWHLYLKYAQMFLQTTKLSTFKTKRALGCLLEKNTGKHDSIIFQILRTVPSPPPPSPPLCNFPKSLPASHALQSLQMSSTLVGLDLLNLMSTSDQKPRKFWHMPSDEDPKRKFLPAGSPTTNLSTQRHWQLWIRRLFWFWFIDKVERPDVQNLNLSLGGLPWWPTG